MSQGQAIPLDQLKALRAQQEANKAQMLLQTAITLFVNGKAESVTDAFTLAEVFLQEFEKRYMPKQ